MILSVKALSKHYWHADGIIRALDKIDLSVESGSFVTITGASGSGKTTLLLALGGLLRPTNGEILFKGDQLQLNSERHMSEFRKNHVGYVMQSFALIPYLTATENIMLGYNKQAANLQNKKEIVTAVLDVVDLTNRKNHYPRELSAGQQQRVAIARALVKSPTFILADEPTGNLDPALSLEILSLLKQINRENGITVVMVTHSPAAAEMGNVRIHLNNGIISNN